MAIQTSVKRSFIYWNLLYLVLCGGLGAWGAYDYWVTIPAQQKAVAEYGVLVEELAGLEIRGKLWQLAGKQKEGVATPEEVQELQELEKTLQEAGTTKPPPPLNESERARYTEIKDILKVDFDNTPPEPPASYDGWVNLWVYFVGCGILGTPWFVWKLVSRRGQIWTLEDDGSLQTPNGTFAAEQILDIDMSIWMKKSLAKVMVDGQTDPIVLDDYEYQNAYLIVGALANQFHPDEWTAEAKPAKDVKAAGDPAEAEPEEDSGSTENADQPASTPESDVNASED
ncbi:MAG: hypothetical protein CMJ23_07675 [Phycisphaerae bacterium]|nr:hypothetical protein [Phycisphaerae bacterium]